MKRTTFLKSLAGLAVLPLMSFKDIFKSKEDEAIAALNQIELVGLQPYWRTNEKNQFEIKYPRGHKMTWYIRQINDNQNFFWSCGGTGEMVNSDIIPKRPMVAYDIVITLDKDGNIFERTWARAITVLPPVFHKKEEWVTAWGTKPCHIYFDPTPLK